MAMDPPTILDPEFCQGPGRSHRWHGRVLRGLRLCLQPAATLAGDVALGGHQLADVVPGTQGGCSTPVGWWLVGGLYYPIYWGLQQSNKRIYIKQPVQMWKIWIMWLKQCHKPPQLGMFFLAPIYCDFGNFIVVLTTLLRIQGLLDVGTTGECGYNNARKPPHFWWFIPFFDGLSVKKILHAH